MTIEAFEPLDQCMTLNEISTPAEIGKCFANVADLLINGYTLFSNQEQYRISAVEFYYFNPLHLDFSTCLLIKQDFIRWILDYASSGITIAFRQNTTRPNAFNPPVKLEENTYFGFVLITDIAPMSETCELERNISLNGMLKNKPFDRIEEMRRNDELPRFSIKRKPRTSSYVKFDDVYECVRNVRRNVRTGKYSREEIANALIMFHNKRYRFEMFTQTK